MLYTLLSQGDNFRVKSPPGIAKRLLLVLMSHNCFSSVVAASSRKTFELLHVLLIGKPIRGVCDYRAGCFAGKTSRLMGSRVLAQHTTDPFGILFFDNYPE